MAVASVALADNVVVHTAVAVASVALADNVVVHAAVVALVDDVVVLLDVVFDVFVVLVVVVAAAVVHVTSGSSVETVYASISTNIYSDVGV